MNKYSHIKSLSELRVEKLRLEYKIENKEQLLEQRVSRIRYICSVDGVLSYFKSKVSSGVSLIKNVAQGYEFVVGMFEKFRSQSKS